MILETVHATDTQPAMPAFPHQPDSLYLLQIDSQDTMQAVLDVLRSEKRPVLLQLPPDGDAFSRSDDMITLRHFLTEQEHHPFVCVIIPPHRTDVVALATTYSIPNTPSIEEAFHTFEQVILHQEARISHPLGLAPSGSRPDRVAGKQQSREAPFSLMTPKTRWLLPARGKIALLLVVSALVLPLMLLVPITHPSSHASTPVPHGTLSFESSGQFDPALTQGYNDIVQFSLQNIPAPPHGFSYAAWLMPDPSDTMTAPLRLGSFQQGSISLTYASPSHTNLLASYSGVRVTIQPEKSASATPSHDPKTWRWQGFIADAPTPGDEKNYSLLSHLRHVLASDPTLQANTIPGGLNLWLTRNVSKVEEWASAAQGDWHGPHTSSGDGDQIHRQLLRILEYLDGMFYYQRDVPAGSPWIVDPLAGKIGLLDRVQNQQPSAFLAHVNIHLTGLASSPGHTMQQQQLATIITTVIARMTTDLQQVRKDATLLVAMNTHQLQQAGTQEKLNEIANLTSEVKSGWFDPQTGENRGGVLWMTSRLQQLASVSVG